MQNVDFEELARRSCEGVLASAAALYAAELWEQKVAFVLETAAEQSAAADALRGTLQDRLLSAEDWASGHTNLDVAGLAARIEAEEAAANTYRRQLTSGQRHAESVQNPLEAAQRELLALEREQREYERAIYVKQKAAADAAHRRRSSMRSLSISMRSSFA
ncbi:hypothetical protein DIPPA_33549 [Diplonema papillatum]|nr:hypothetical protein DIPPA_33549 [Diplonema papillatum]|eukprot:gene5281-8064_t